MHTYYHEQDKASNTDIGTVQRNVEVVKTLAGEKVGPVRCLNPHMADVKTLIIERDNVLSTEICE